MRRPMYWILLFAFAASLLGWETYSAWTVDMSRSDSPAAGFAVPARPGAIGDNAKVVELSGGASLDTNVRLFHHNVRLGSRIAIEFSRIKSV